VVNRFRTTCDTHTHTHNIHALNKNKMQTHLKTKMGQFAIDYIICIINFNYINCVNYKQKHDFDLKKKCK